MGRAQGGTDTTTSAQRRGGPAAQSALGALAQTLANHLTPSQIRSLDAQQWQGNSAARAFYGLAQARSEPAASIAARMFVPCALRALRNALPDAYEALEAQALSAADMFAREDAAELARLLSPGARARLAPELHDGARAWLTGREEGARYQTAHELVCFERLRQQLQTLGAPAQLPVISAYAERALPAVAENIERLTQALESGAHDQLSFETSTNPLSKWQALSAAASDRDGLRASEALMPTVARCAAVIKRYLNVAPSQNVLVVGDALWELVNDGEPMPGAFTSEWGIAYPQKEAEAAQLQKHPELLIHELVHSTQDVEHSELSALEHLDAFGAWYAVEGVTDAAASEAIRMDGGAPIKHRYSEQRNVVLSATGADVNAIRELSALPLEQRFGRLAKLAGIEDARKGAQALQAIQSRRLFIYSRSAPAQAELILAAVRSCAAGEPVEAALDRLDAQMELYREPWGAVASERVLQAHADGLSVPELAERLRRQWLERSAHQAAR